MRLIERVWGANRVGVRILAPLGWIFGVVTALRNTLFDLGVFRSVPLGLPAISVGNLSVGGTGKTPMAAWIAAELRALGERPAVVLRGYGADEPLVHERLNADVPVIVSTDRVAGAAEAKRRGATVVVLDDAFQHRRAKRDLDVVLVAAEQRGRVRLLPAGPFREGGRALRRAHLLVVTRKSAAPADAEAVAAFWRRAGGAPPVVHVALVPGALRRAEGPNEAPARDPAADPGDGRHPQAHPSLHPTQLRPESLRGRRVLALSAIGQPMAFESQLRDLGAIVESAPFPDHHPFSDGDIAQLVTRAAAVDMVVCTLKDAVKLGPRWPHHAPPLWYLSQSVVVEQGRELLAGALAAVVHRRPFLVAPPNAGI